MHAYRTHTCGALRLADAGRPARLSGWVHRKRDHGHLLFIDLRDHYGITQCVIDASSPLFAATDALRLESVLTLTGTVEARSPDTVNPKLDTQAFLPPPTPMRRGGKVLIPSDGTPVGAMGRTGP